MIQNEDTHTNARQRLTIMAIAVFTLLATFALYASIVLSASGDNNSSTTSLLTDEEQARYDELSADYQAFMSQQAKELSAQYFDEFSAYKSRVRAFNAADATELITTDLKVGDGVEVTDQNFTDYAAYYIGWLSDETVFDSSLDNVDNPTSLKEPLSGSTSMIEGWLEGIVGMKIGGIREITIPSVLGYADQGSELIPANSPLKFVVMLIDPLVEYENIDELNELYAKASGITIN